MSYIQPIFELGRRYIVKRSFESGASSRFLCGESLVFERNYYSHYDNCFVYEFRSTVTGELKTWWLHEDQDKEQWREFFAEAN